MSIIKAKHIQDVSTSTNAAEAKKNKSKLKVSLLEVSWRQTNFSTQQLWKKCVRNL